MSQATFQIDCLSCNEPIVFSVFDEDTAHSVVSCEGCGKKYALGEETVGQLKKFARLCRQIQESEDILGNASVAVEVGPHKVQVPFKLLLTRLKSTLVLQIANERIVVTFRTQPTSLKKRLKMDQLHQLKTWTTVVADTGDIEAIRAYIPTDATTNPSLILQACKRPEYRYLMEKAIKDTQHIISSKEDRFTHILDQIYVGFGLEILKIVPGRVSTEVDASLSFDTEQSIAKARHLISLYEKAHVPRERILIKLASTWEGMRAAEVLEIEGIHCNMTLVFSLPQAIACAEAKATLISPFVGRILDWYKKNVGGEYIGENDPGVKSVRSIYAYLKKFDFRSQIMGASFRNKGQILELAGCDLLTISPTLLQELQESRDLITRKLSVEGAKSDPIQRMHLNESQFRYLFNDDPMAVDKLAEGIRIFAKDSRALVDYVRNEYPEIA